MGEKVRIDIFGSCFTRLIFNEGTGKPGCSDEQMEIAAYERMQNMVCCMMPKPFSERQIDSIRLDELTFNPVEYEWKDMKKCMRKSAVETLLKSDGQWLFFDLYDFHLEMAAYHNTCFVPLDYNFYHTRLYKELMEEEAGSVTTIHFLEQPECMWYPYVDLFMHTMTAKYGADHMVLSRFHCADSYLDRWGRVQPIPDDFDVPHVCNSRYNDKIRKLENYIIEKYHPHVIDISKYFVASDSIINGDCRGAHLEKSYYEEALCAVRKLVFHEEPEEMPIYQNAISCETLAGMLEKPATDKDFWLAWQKRENPFHANASVLAQTMQDLSIDELIGHRKLLAALLHQGEKLSTMVLTLLIERKWKIEEASQQEFLRYFLEKMRIKEKISKMKEEFLQLLEADNFAWIEKLYELEALAPEDKEVSFYMQQYQEILQEMDAKQLTEDNEMEAERKKIV